MWIFRLPSHKIIIWPSEMNFSHVIWDFENLFYERSIVSHLPKHKSMIISYTNPVNNYFKSMIKISWNVSCQSRSTSIKIMNDNQTSNTTMSLTTTGASQQLLLCEILESYKDLLQPLMEIIIVNFYLFFCWKFLSHKFELKLKKVI